MLTWGYIKRKYVGRKYCGKRNDSQFTVTVVDVTLGGDVVVQNHRFGESTWKQADFLAFVKDAKEIYNGHVPIT